MQLQIGATYADKYRIVRVLGEGAMGAVYEAENVRIHRRVAIKILHPQIAQKADTLRRFEREAQAAGRIGSKHIIEVLDLGELADGSRFMVMEFLEGTTLDQRIRSRGRLSPEDATPIIAQLLEGLGAAHDAGIIHRDLKPANIFLTTARGAKDFVKILDFGVSKFNVLNDEMSMTSTGAVLGTPYYMSPEQAKGSRQVDPRSDLYAVGVILYECITGQVPFSAETFNELIFRIVLESPPPVESFVPNLDPAFTALIHKAMAREANDRFQTAAEFRMSILKWAEASAAGPVLPAAIGLGPKPGGPAIGVGGTMLMDPGPAPAGAPAIGASNGQTVAMNPDARGPAPWQPVPPPLVPAPPGFQPRQQAPTAALPSFLDPAQGAPGGQGAPGLGQGTQIMPGAMGAPAGMGQAGPQMAPGQPMGMGQPAGAAMAPVYPEEPYQIPKRSSGALAFGLGLLGVLVLGGVAVAAMKWSGDKNASAGQPSTTAVATEAPPATGAPPATAAEPSSTAAAPAATPSAVPSTPEPVAVVKPPTTPVSKPTGPSTTPTTHTTSPTKTPGPGGPGKTPGKRTISTEL